jgi:hypothetical protein
MLKTHPFVLESRTGVSENDSWLLNDHSFISDQRSFVLEHVSGVLKTSTWVLKLQSRLLERHSLVLENDFSVLNVASSIVERGSLAQRIDFQHAVSFEQHFKCPFKVGNRLRKWLRTVGQQAFRKELGGLIVVQDGFPGVGHS